MIDATKAYTLKELIDEGGWPNPETAREELFQTDPPVRHFTIGRRTFIRGQAFLDWIEEHDGLGGAPLTSRRPKKPPQGAAAASPAERRDYQKRSRKK